MEIPSEWYIYVIPGIIILASFIPLLNVESLEKLLKRFNDNIIPYTAIIGFFAYIVGFVSNAVSIECLKPLFNKIYWLSEPTGIKYTDPILISSGYQSQILYRLMFGAFFLFTVSTTVGLLLKKKINNWNSFFIRLIFIIILIVSTIALGMKWWDHREKYFDFSSKSVPFPVLKQNN